MKPSGAKLPRIIELVALSALVIGATALLIGDFGVRLATSTADDSPALLARYLVDPTPFRGDILESFATVYGLGTIVHWGPALLLRWLNVAPETASLGLAYLQNVLLALAVWALARAAGATRASAWAAALFTLAAEVYLWNLANYRSQMQVPYAGHMVLPLVTLTAAALLARSDLAATITLTLSALVHPTVTLLVMPPLAILLLKRNDTHTPDRPASKPAARSLLHTALVFLPAFVAALGVAVLVRNMAPPALDHADLLQAMRANVHMNPLDTARFSRVLLPAYGGFLVLLGLALQQRQLSPAYRRLLLAMTAATAGYALLHVLALRAGWSTIITLVPLRFTMVLALFAVPAIITMLIGVLGNTSFAAQWAAAALLVLLPLSSLSVHWPALAALTLVMTLRQDTDTPRRAVLERVALALLILWTAAAMASAADTALGNSVAWLVSLFTLGAAQSAQTLLGGIAVAALLAFLVRAPQQRERAGIMMAALCAIMLLVRNTTKGADTRDSRDRDLYEAQQWARAQSPADAVFIIEPNVPWRVVSGRRAVPLWPNDAHVYSGSRAAFEYARDVRAHVTRQPLTNAAAIASFRKRFGGDYLVREAERITPYAPVYGNAHFAIYRLPAADSLEQ